MNSNFFCIDNWPIVYIKNKNSIITDEIIEEYKKDYLSVLIRCKNNNEKIYIIINIYFRTDVPIKFMQSISKFNKSIYDYNKKYVNYIYILCESKIFKNVLSMMIAMEKPASPYKIVRSTEKLKKLFHENHGIQLDDNNVMKSITSDLQVV